MDKNPVIWFEIYVNDADRAKKFYETVFQFKLEDLSMPDSGDMRMLMFPAREGAPNCTGALVKSDMMTPGCGGTLLYFDTKDCTAELDRVAAAGGKVLQPKFEIGEYGFIGVLQDTEGNTIGVHSRE